jgi:hypothetical protein
MEHGFSQMGAERNWPYERLHESGTKFDSHRAKLAKLASSEGHAAAWRKSLVSCRLRQSLAPKNGRKKLAALNVGGANSFQ